MALVINELFNGPSGVALDTTNTSATSLSGTGSSVFDTATAAAEGSASAQFTTSGTYRQAAWALTSTSTGYFSFYITPQSLPSINTQILRLGTTNTAISCAVSYQLSGGKVKLGDSTSTVVGSFTTDSLVIGELNRIDLSFNGGAIKMELYPGNAQAGNAVGTATAGNTKAGTTAVTTFAYRTLGHNQSGTLTSRFDAFREDNTALPGPVVTAAPTALTAALVETDTLAAALISPTALTVAFLETETLVAALSSPGASLAVVPSAGIIPFTVTATCTVTGAGATPSFAWAWGDGTTTAASASSSATHVYSSSGLYSPVCTVVP